MRLAAVLLAAWLQPPAGHAPPIQNAQVQVRSAAGGLAGAMQAVLAAQAAPSWVGYRVPAVAGHRQTCADDNYAATVHLEGPAEFYILYRIDEHRIERIRTFSPDCVIDAGNVPFYWLADVRPADSVQYLAGLAREPRGRYDALRAIAVHAAPEAAQTLLEMARHGDTSHIRGQALYGLAQAAPPQVSTAAIREAIDRDPDNSVKRQAVSALGQIPHHEGVPMLLELARQSRDRDLQKQAMHVLGHTRDERAYQFFEQILTH